MGRWGGSGLAASWLVLFALACGDDGNGPTEPEGPDLTAPAAITDLRSSFEQATSLRLNWTAPGDDDEQGTAAEYDVRISTSEITLENWRQATRIENVPRPLPALTNERLSIGGLRPNTLYWFVVSAADEAGNWSGVSNVHSARTLEAPDGIPPAPVTDLAVVSVGSTSVVLTWTATGDDADVGTAFAYDIRLSPLPITEENFFDIVGDGIPDVSPIPAEAGATETWEIPELTPATTYYLAMKVLDDARNYSALSNHVMITTEP